MKIKVLGTGCTKCKKLYNEVKKALANSTVDAELEKVENLDDIIKYGVMITPALVINEKVKSSGKIPKHAEILSFITSEAVESQK